jgi:hypothetical protein
MYSLLPSSLSSVSFKSNHAHSLTACLNLVNVLFTCGIGVFSWMQKFKLKPRSCSEQHGSSFPVRLWKVAFNGCMSIRLRSILLRAPFLFFHRGWFGLLVKPQSFKFSDETCVMAPLSLFVFAKRISCVRESSYAFTVHHLWQSRDDLERTFPLSLYHCSFCSSGVGVVAAHLEQDCSDSMVGGSTRVSEKLGCVVWKPGLGGANDCFVHMVEAARRGIVQTTMAGSLVAFAVRQSVPRELVHNDRSAHSRGRRRFYPETHRAQKSVRVPCFLLNSPMIASYPVWSYFYPAFYCLLFAGVVLGVN